MEVSVVIPCYNSCDFISAIVERTEKTLKSRLAQADYEIILINDNSSDRTFEVISQIASENKNVRAIDLSKNFGQHGAIMAGFSVSTGDIVVCMDDDGQTPPEEIYKLIDKVNEGYDLVYSKYATKRHSRFRNWGSKLNDLMAKWLIGKPDDITLSSFFAARLFLVDKATEYKNPYPYVAVLMHR